MTDAWPATLPQRFNVDGFQQGNGDGRVRSKTDTGPAKVRVRSSAVVSALVGSMDMSGTQYEYLLTFGVTTLLRWTLPFTFPDPAGGSDLLVRFGEELPSKSEIVPDLWRVPLKLEILP